MPEPAVGRGTRDHREALAHSPARPARTAVRVPSIAYWMFNYEPHWEAVSMEMHALATAFRPTLGTRTFGLNTDERTLRLSGADRCCPALLGLAALPLLLRIARATPVNHIFASPSDRILTPRLARLPNTVLTIAKAGRTLAGVHRNADALRKLRCIVVESDPHRELLLQLGIPVERVRLIRPGVEPRPYRPAGGPFTLLFATSPKTPGLLLTRGIYLLLAVAARLPEVRIRLVWRWKPAYVRNLVRERGLGNVEVLAGYRQDMDALYDEAHAVVLPGLEPDSFKPCPHSGLQALAHGKPLLVSRQVCFAEIVARRRCGIVFEPCVEALCDAIRRLADSYEEYRANTAPTLAAEFSRDVFLERYGRLYASLLSAQNAISARHRSTPS
jgi:glycosyltransferase involved in cell wall biosynthesis